MKKCNSSRKSNCNSNVFNEDKNTQDYSNHAGDRCIYIQLFQFKIFHRCENENHVNIQSKTNNTTMRY